MRIRSLLLFTLMVVSSLAVAQTPRRDIIVSPEWLASHPDAIVLEIGNRDAYAEGHIPGARFIELQSIVTDRDGTLNELPPVESLERVFTDAGVGERGRIVVYSRDPLFAARAWFTLDYLGQGSRTSYLDGGYARWTSEQRPVSTETVPVVPVAFRASVRRELVVSLKAMQTLVKWRKELGSDLAMIDARAPEQFCGKEAGAGVERGGHIPGAVNVLWTENLTTDVTQRLLPDRELRELYTSAGVSPRSTNIVYCRTGMQATLNYVVLKYLGYDVALYDGSFTEWSGQADTHVALMASLSNKGAR
jgi:thiosulfate/3-mercaptopyruvate sulfurtransferase